MTAHRAEVGFAPALHPGEQRRVKRITLRAVTSLAGALALPLFAGRSFHGVTGLLMRRRRASAGFPVLSAGLSPVSR